MKTPLPSEQFITTVDLSIPIEKNIYQFIYGSHLFGTSFAIYSQFDSEAPVKNSTKINKIIFKLINYKGCVNIGLVGSASYKKVKRTHVITLNVKPLASSLNTIEFNNNGSGIIIKDGDEINFQRLIKPYDYITEGENDSGRSQESIFFDGEFNYRDGYYEAYVPPRPGQVNYVPINQPFPSPRCHQARVNPKFCINVTSQ